MPGYSNLLNLDGQNRLTAADYSKSQERWVNTTGNLADAGVVLTTTPLGASASYTQTGVDRLAPTGTDKPAFPVGQVRGLVWADQAGTLYLEESENNSSWTTTATISVSAGTTTELTWTSLTKRYYRFRYVNGSNAQTSFVLVQQAAGLAVPNVALTGSNVVKGATATVTTAGTRVQLPSYSCREVTIIAKRTNTGYIYVGGSDVSSTVYGAELSAKDSITLQVSNTNLVYIDASVSGEGISYVAI